MGTKLVLIIVGIVLMYSVFSFMTNQTVFTSSACILAAVCYVGVWIKDELEQMTKKIEERLDKIEKRFIIE